MEINPERERQRLREEYSRKIDGELEQIAADEADLTDLARNVLKEEMSRRALSVRPGPQLIATGKLYNTVNDVDTSVAMAEAVNGQSDSMCVLRKFVSFCEALIAKTCLDGSGIECSLADENILGANPFLSTALGGVRLFVKQSDFAEATKLLDEPIPDEFAVDGIGKYVQPRCPRCFSLDITFGELTDAAKVSLPLGLPLSLSSDEWLCHKCGSRWTDSEER
jgi:hypothetical protein